MLNNNLLIQNRNKQNYLKIKRWEAGLKQYELASLLMCSSPYLSMVENMRLDPPEEFKKKAASILKVPVDEIFPLKKCL